MSTALHDAILERLESNVLPDEAVNQLLSAVADDSEPVGTSPQELSPTEAYLKSITVTSFRGIGPTARIDFKPGPGLTIVCGRNGSGKSSFAEALEVLITGQVRRLKGRTGVWRNGWRSLHSHVPPEVRSELTMEGVRGSVLIGSWSEDGKLEECQVRVKVPGEPDSGIERFGWQRALELYRPFLSHAELEVVLDKPSELHDQLNAVLGLQELNDVAQRLADRRRALEEKAKAATRSLDALKLELPNCPDPRAGEAAQIVAAKKPNLEAVQALVAGADGPPAGEIRILDALRGLEVPASDNVQDLEQRLRTTAEQLDRVTVSAAGLASESADLLAAAVAHFGAHGPGDCPVCGRPDALNDEWLGHTKEQIERLRLEAAEMQEARDTARQLAADVTRVLTPAPAVLGQASQLGIDPTAAEAAWKTWAAFTLESVEAPALRRAAEHLSKTYLSLAHVVADLAEAAAKEYERRRDTWSPVAARLAQWCSGEREAATAREAVKEIKKAETWLKDTNHHLRNERLRPYVEGASHIWEQLRQESNVDLRNITLEGSRTRREVEFELSVDGTDAPGLPVLSQGETNALALSVFLPRATAEGSPFRFVVIDDPVQAMDPAKVDGLARVLAEVAANRQVIVFTHDDRLPEAVRRLNLGGRIIQVTRKSESVVQISSAGDPSEQLLSDAGKLVREHKLSELTAAKVIPGLCREAIELACYEITRARRLGRGDTRASVEVAIREPTTLVSRLALAIFDDAAKGGDVYSWLNKNLGPWAYDTVQTCNRGAHGTAGFDRGGLVGDTRKLVEQLREKLK
jgi:recombinational DNA repair ATPase RecF